MQEIESLIDQLENLLIQIDVQIDSVQAYCVGDGIRASELRAKDGKWVMVDLLSAKAQVLDALERNVSRMVVYEQNLHIYNQEIAKADELIRSARGVDVEEETNE